ncbi:MAG: Crp/Fnr family transcriptional regulator [Gammaproteobacteria bacterium]|nr:Crp/Fnr family transcriptional regulator [Gammaproteobacteria bacterium]
MAEVSGIVVFSVKLNGINIMLIVDELNKKAKQKMKDQPKDKPREKLREKPEKEITAEVKDRIKTKIPLFFGISDDDSKAILSHAIVRKYARNTILIQEGDPGEALFIIRSGRVKVYLSDESGKEIILNTLGEGEHFGEMSLLDREPRSASIMTIDSSELFVVTRDNFEKALLLNPRIAINLLKDLSQTLRFLTDNVKSLALLDVYGRVARTLMISAKPYNENSMIVEEQLTHQELANRVGASREMISRILKDLSKGGYIRIEDKHIVINNRLPAGY